MVICAYAAETRSIARRTRRFTLQIPIAQQHAKRACRSFCAIRQKLPQSFQLNTETQWETQTMVMVKEVIREAAPAAQQAATAVQPNAAQQQARIAYLVKQIAADDAQPKQPTPQEKMAAMDEYKRQKKQADLELVQKLRYQLATAEAVLAANNEEEVSKPSTGLGRERR